MRPELKASSDVFKRIFIVLSLGVITGITASLAAIGFVESIFWLNDHLLVTFNSRKTLVGSVWYAPLTVAIPTLGGLICGLVIWQIKDKRIQSMGDVILSVQARLGKSALGLKDAILTVIATITSLGSGASLGQYGPIVHLGAVLSQRLTGGTRIDPATALGCGVAAGISTVFSAPIAGIVFAHEVILRHYSLRAFAPITVASSVGFYLATFVFNRPPLIESPPVRIAYAPEFFAFVAIGIIGALVAVSFMRLILTFGKLSQKLSIWQPFKPAIAGLVLGLIAIEIPEVMGIGKHTLQAALFPVTFSVSDLSILLFAKILVTALCLGFGMAGGIFSPALLVGILLGALIGQGVDSFFPDHSSFAIYAISGMAAVTSPIIGAPLSTILIVFELTQSYELATAVMVSVVFSNVVAYRLFGRSLYDVQLNQRGFDLSLGRERLLLDQITMGGMLELDFSKATPTQTLNGVKTDLIRSNRSEAFVIDKHDHFRGTLTLNQILIIEDSLDLSKQLVSDHLTSAPLIFSTEMSVWSAMEAMQDFVGESIAVIDSEDNTLAGVVHESTLIAAYLKSMKELREEEHAAA